jgi:hypothetical protein
MCYCEGTKDEIKFIDPNDLEASCLCNNTNYTGSLDAQASLISTEDRLKIHNERGYKPPQTNPQISQDGANLLNRLNTQLDGINKTNEILIEAITLLAEVLREKKG